MCRVRSLAPSTFSRGAGRGADSAWVLYAGLACETASSDAEGAATAPDLAAADAAADADAEADDVAEAWGGAFFGVQPSINTIESKSVAVRTTWSLVSLGPSGDRRC
jgi:hypothetical protein